MYKDGSYWFSALRTYLECPELYKATHIDKVVPTEASLDMEFGSAMHLGLEKLLKGEDGKLYFDTYWKSIEGQDLKRYRFDWKCLEYNGHVFLDRFARLHQKHFAPKFMEERIFTELKGKKLEGTPDMLGNYRGVPSVVDFKTASTKYEKEMIVCEEQLSFYAALAIKALEYRPEQKVYVVFNKSYKKPSISVLKKELTEYNINSTMDNMMAVIEQIEAKKFYRNTHNCVKGSSVCPNFNRCFGDKK